MLNGSRYRSMGFNLYYAAFRVGQAGVSTNLNLGDNNTKLADSLDALTAATSGKAKVVRVMFFQTQATLSGVRDWYGLDKVLSVCAAKGYRVIAYLMDQWNYIEGPTKLTSYYQTGYTSTVFSGNTVPFRTWVGEVSARYANDPTILCWELVNEGQPFDTYDDSTGAMTFTDATSYSAARSFTIDIFSVIRSSDANHLMHHGFAYDGTAGKNYTTNYRDLCAITGNDFWNFHDYASSAGGLAAVGAGSVTAALPMLVGEYSRDIATVYTLAGRATFFDSEFTSYEGYGTYCGAMQWVWNNEPGQIDNLFETRPGDPLLATVVAHDLSGTSLPHDSTFIGPSYYAQWSHGPSSSMDYFPILTYHVNLVQWDQLITRLLAAGINGVYMAYDQSGDAVFNAAAANGFSIFIAQGGTDIATVRSNPQVATAYAMGDEPNQDGTIYAPSNGTPSNDVGANRYVTDANAQRAADPSRPMVGNFTKDIMDYTYPPSGWTTPQFEQHNRTMLGALDITSADLYGWSDPWEWNQGTYTPGTSLTACGWIYGYAIERQKWYNPNALAFGFVDTCCDGNSPPLNTVTANMIETAVWNVLVHGARGFSYWPRDFYHTDDQPYTGATYTEEYSVYGDHQWDAQYARMSQVNAKVTSVARQLNSPTVSGISATGQSGVPVTALGKDYGGKLWLLAQADGNYANPLSNTTSMTGTITLPAAVPAGTIFDVDGESRTVTVNASHQIVDTFAPTTETPFYSGVPLTYGYAHHIYQAR